MLNRVCVQILARKRPHLQKLHSNLYNIYTTQEHMPRNTCKITGQQRVMFNKIVNTNRTITKFATFVPYTCMILCTDFGKKRTSFAEVTLKNLMDQSLWTRACGSPEGGRGSMDHYQICYRCSICLNE